MKKQNGLFMTSVMLLALSVAMYGGQASAADLSDLDNSIQLAPADTAIYVGMYRCGELVEKIEASKAWQNVTELPLVQFGLQKYADAELVLDPDSGEAVEIDFDDPWVKFRMFIENPQAKATIATLADMASEDMFVMAGPEMIDIIELANKVQSEANIKQLDSQASDQYEDVAPSKLQAAFVLDTLSKNLDLMKTPQLLVGFKVNQPEQAQAQINLLGGIVAMLSMTQPELAKHISQTKVGDSNFITITASGKDIPWDEIPMDELEAMELESGQAESVVEKAQTMKVCLAVGILNDYVLISVADSTDYLETLGQGDLLTSVDTLKPLAKFADKPLVSVSYVSEDFVQRVGFGPKDIDKFEKMAISGLDMSDLDDDAKAEIKASIPVFKRLVMAMIPEPGSYLDFSFMTGQGIEEYVIADTKSPCLDGTKPLSILSHVGGDPVVMLSSRTMVSEEGYGLVADSVDAGLKIFDLLAPPQMSKKERKKYKKFIGKFRPMLDDLDQVNRELLIPALADGQLALVVDNELESTQFCEFQPETEEPMPMIEPAIVIGVSDSEKLLKALGAYHQFGIDTFELLKSIDPEEFPEEMPYHELELIDSDEGKIWVYEIPVEAGVTDEIQPCYGLNDTTAVFAISVDHAKRILREIPLDVGGLLTETDQPMAGAFTIRFDALLETAKPWVRMGVQQNWREDIPVSEDLTIDEELALQHVDVLFDLLQTVKTVTGTVKTEGGQTVTHSLTVIKDVE